MTIAELGERMGSRELSEWLVFEGLPTRRPAEPEESADPLLQGDKMVAELDRIFGRGKGG